MFTKLKNNKFLVLAVLVVLLATFLRTYRLDTVPPSLSWDEASVGYNAYTVANYGMDEWGKVMPFSFKAFGEYKNPIHIYSTALFVKLLGLSDFSTRASAAFFGVLNVILLIYLGEILFKNRWLGLTAGFFLAISPYNLQFSRFNHEANFALFFFMLGLILFFKGLEKRKHYLVWSFISFILSMLAYNAAKIVVPIIVFLLLVLYFKKIFEQKINLLIIGLICLITVVIIFLNPGLTGLTRAKQASIEDSKIETTQTFIKTHNHNLSLAVLYAQRYAAHFNPEYLFVSGDQNDQFSTKKVGTFYKIDIFFLLSGLFFILIKPTRKNFLVLSWVLLGPLPAAITGGFYEVPHAARAMFVMGSWNLVAAVGFINLTQVIKRLKLRLLMQLALLVIVLVFLLSYLKDYYNYYPIRAAIGWQYGMKQIVDFVKLHPEYNQVYVTNERHQPYIFFLYYLKTPLPQFLSSVTYNKDQSSSYNLVSSFDKYHFGDWNPIESSPRQYVLYVVTPSQYDGLRYKTQFNLRQVIKYPNGEDAFYLVSLF